VLSRGTNRLMSQWVGGNAKITTQMHDILVLTEPVSWWEC
jgi:hypothetical protein